MTNFERIKAMNIDEFSEYKIAMRCCEDCPCWEQCKDDYVTLSVCKARYTDWLCEDSGD